MMKKQRGKDKMGRKLDRDVVEKEGKVQIKKEKK